MAEFHFTLALFYCDRCNKANDQAAPPIHGSIVKERCKHCGWENTMRFMLARWEHIIRVIN